MIQTRSTIRYARIPAWPRWPLLAALTILLGGPVVAPLFQATHMWLVADSGALARALLATYVCPTPAKSYMLLGYPMAVCARCWGATIGLWLAWAAMQRWTVDGGWWTPLRLFVHAAWPVRLALAALPFLLWPAEIVFWPAAPLQTLLLDGALAGASAGLFFCSIWPGLVMERRA